MLHQILFKQVVSLTGMHLAPLAFALLAYMLGRALYLLNLHPLASFPGPRLAALSTWWLYFVSRGGCADQVFEELHRKYNTRALRISPNEIHISDANLYHTIYSQDQAYLKHADFYAGFGTPHTAVVETDRALHRQRRKKMNNFFSKASVRAMHHLLYEKVDRLCTVVMGMSDKGPLNIYNAVRCMTIDIISDLGFGQSFDLMGQVKETNFEADFLQAFDLVVATLWNRMYLPLLQSIMAIVPPSLAIAMGGPPAAMARLHLTTRDAVSSFQGAKVAGNSMSHKVLFEGLSDLDQHELNAEAIDVLVAGADTTATTLAVAINLLTANHKAYEALKHEVRQANLASVDDFELTSLERLPYLMACVKESLRSQTPIPGRLPRIVPGAKSGVAPLVVDGKVIPAGTIVGISASSVHRDPTIWGPDVQEFKPERWLGPDSKQLDKYLVSFSRGARQCLGSNLAYAELALALAMFTTRFDFTRDETMTPQDVEVFDGFIIGFRGSGTRVRVAVRNV
ncbi:hypothetical protein BDW74DRAFT_105802 [Aspergillus multicolor]|uniref:cytochrome P450 n=1 Tax=Aspergillus multicolor TaxID=41759 RepID=UPI003CCCA5AB